METAHLGSGRRRVRALSIAVGIAAAGLAVACGPGNGGGPSGPDGTGGLGTATDTPTSGAPTTTTTEPASGPTIVSFERVGPACDGNNEVTLRWTLGGTATGATISIDGPGIYDTYPGTSRQEKFPGACGTGNTQTFLLTTIGGSPAATQTLVVNPPAPAPSPTAPTILTFERVGPACDGNNQVTLRWTLGGTATGATISIDGPGIYDTYPGTSREEKFPGACNGDTQTFLLTTIGGSPAATRTLVVNP